jgi:hypothetical protein
MKVINLLPKKNQLEIRYEVMLRSLWVTVIFSILSFIVVFIAQFGTKLYLQLQASTLNAEIVQLQGQVNKQENAQVKTKIQQENNLITDYENLVTNSPKWSQLIKAFTPLPPPGVKISSFEVNPSNQGIEITGFAPTRELVIQLYNNILQDSKDFYGIDYPLENVVMPTNISFHYSFYYRSTLTQ